MQTIAETECLQKKKSPLCTHFELKYPELKAHFKDCSARPKSEFVVECTALIGVGSAVTIAAIIVGAGPMLVTSGAYAAYKIATDPDSDERKCFYNIPEKRARIEKFNSATNDPRFHASLDEEFIKNITCLELRRLLESKFKSYLLFNKSTPEVYTAKKLDNGLFNPGLLEAIGDIKSSSECLDPEVAGGIACAAVGGLAGIGPGAIVKKSLRAKIESIWSSQLATKSEANMAAKPMVASEISTPVSSVTNPAYSSTAPAPIDSKAASETALAGGGYVQRKMSFAQERRLAAKPKEKKMIQTDINGLPKFEKKLSIPKPTPSSLDPELAAKFPLLESKLGKVDSRFAEFPENEAIRGEKNVRTFYKNIFSSKEFSKNPKVYSIEDREAYAKVARHFADNESWKVYVKNLYIEAAEWIAKSGNASEVAAMAKTGDISERSLIATLFRRAKARGDGFGKSKSQDVVEFAALRESGVWIDRAFPPHYPHGQFSHLLQMDYVAPVLREHYNGSQKAFYQFLENQCKECWTYLFDDARVKSFHNSSVVHKFIKDVLPIKGKDAAP
jgi:hypothetical protein